MEFSCLAEIIDYNPYNNNLTIKCDFISPESLSILESVIKEKRKAMKLHFNFSPKKSKQYGQQKCWFGSIRLILMAREIDITSENLKMEDEEQRRGIFPAKQYEIDGKIRRRPKRMSELSFDEMQECIAKLHDRHQHLTIKGKPIDFSNLKLI